MGSYPPAGGHRFESCPRYQEKLFVLTGGFFNLSMLSAMYTVYVLYSPKYDKIYIGMTTNLEMRVFAHNNLPKGWTRKFRPWDLTYKEEYLSKKEATARENALKSYQGREFIRRLIKER